MRGIREAFLCISSPMMKYIGVGTIIYYYIAIKQLFQKYNFTFILLITFNVNYY